MIAVEILTKERYAKLQESLQKLEAEHDIIIQRLQEARSLGDLSENAEYDAARDDQGRNEVNLRETRRRISTAKVVEANEISCDVVSDGNAIEVIDDRGQHIVYSLVKPIEGEELDRTISSDGPLGQALLGHAVGDEVSFRTPAGRVRKLTIQSISVAG